MSAGGLPKYDDLMLPVLRLIGEGRPLPIYGGGTVHRLGARVVDEGVGQDHAAEAEAAVEDAFFRQQLGHMAAEAADCALLDGDQRLVLAHQPQDQVANTRR